MSVLLKVQGMSCGHCVAAIKSAVAPLPGVMDVDVDLTGGLVTVHGTADEHAVAAAIEDCGYDTDRAA
jgi:copper chaperone